MYDLAGLRADIVALFGTKCEEVDLAGLDRQGIADELTEEICRSYETKAESIGAERMRYSERMIMLHLIDQQWKDHLLSMDHLKEGIGLRGYGQKDPLVEYKKESFHIFQQMMATFEEETLKLLFHLSIAQPTDRPEEAEPAGVGYSPGRAPVVVERQACGGAGHGRGIGFVR